MFLLPILRVKSYFIVLLTLDLLGISIQWDGGEAVIFCILSVYDKPIIVDGRLSVILSSHPTVTRCEPRSI